MQSGARLLQSCAAVPRQGPRRELARLASLEAGGANAVQIDLRRRRRFGPRLRIYAGLLLASTHESKAGHEGGNDNEADTQGANGTLRGKR